MINISHSLAIIAVVALCTAFLRYAPFLVFAGRKTVPAWITYLGKFLPPAIMTTLVFYCLRNIEFLKGNFGVPEIIATGLVIILHSWKKNILLTVAAGTILYMVMVQSRIF
ncbi:MAG: AzlD domain-containing protein [Lachnospiraceae bacterium]|nr:AzlD domain-containing protein [Lachnospiraceae bacterium]